LLERYKIENEFALKYLLKSLTLAYTKQVNINKIYNELKSQNIRIWKSTLYEYYTYTKNVFYITELENFFSKAGAKKWFLYNIWFNRLLWNSVNYGQSFENLVFLELKKRFEKVFFKKNWYEVDFFVEDANLNIQVCYELTADNIQREIRSLLKQDWKKILVYYTKQQNLNIPNEVKLLNFLEFVNFFASIISCL